MQIVVNVNTQQRVQRVKTWPRHKLPPMARSQKVTRVMAAQASQLLLAERASIAIEAPELPTTLVNMPVITASTPAPVLPVKARKNALDAVLDRDLEAFRLQMQCAADGCRQFSINEERAIATHNKTALKHNQPTIQRNQEDKDSEDGKQDGYQYVADAMQAIIDALHVSFDEYLDALLREIDGLEARITNETDTYHQMRDGIIADAIKTMQEKWMDK